MDAASGGFIAPFLYPELEWDFRLELVKSINVSGHKYGLVYAGIGWVIWRTKDDLPQDLVFHINYLGADQPTFTLNFSKGLSLHTMSTPSKPSSHHILTFSYSLAGSSQIIAQYYQLIRLGQEVSSYSSIFQLYFLLELGYIYLPLLLNLLGLSEHNGDLQRKRNGAKGKFGEEWTL